MAGRLRVRVVLSVAALVAVAPAAAQVGRDAAVCQRTIGREGQKFKKAELKAWQQCLDGFLTGKFCDAAGRDAKIAAAETRFVDNVQKRCPGSTLFAPPPAGLGFAQSCDFEPGPAGEAEDACRALAVNDAASLTRCLICWKQGELRELLNVLYACLPSLEPDGVDCGSPPPACPTDKAGMVCSRAIAKAGIDFFLAKEKAVERCLDAVNKQTIAGPCPDAAAQAKIAAAEQKERARMGRCTQLPPWWNVCPEDSTPPCDQTIATVDDITTCIDQAGEVIADEVICQQYPGAAAHGVACPPAEPTTSTNTTTPTTSTSTTTVAAAPCGNDPPGAPLCWGTCPPATPICAVVSGACTCIAGTTPCGSASFPQCDGACPPDQACLPSLTLGCTCDFQGVPCAISGYPSCGGVCAGGDDCVGVSTPDGDGCLCVPHGSTCWQTYPACGGTCPTGTCGPSGIPGLCSCP